jgi:hypothetical protein
VPFDVVRHRSEHGRDIASRKGLVDLGDYVDALLRHESSLDWCESLANVPPGKTESTATREAAFAVRCVEPQLAPSLKFREALPLPVIEVAV